MFIVHVTMQFFMSSYTHKQLCIAKYFTVQLVPNNNICTNVIANVSGIHLFYIRNSMFNVDQLYI